MTRLAFICRGSVTVGLGHVMRTRTVATEALSRAEVHVVAVGDTSICRTLLEGHIPYSVVHDDQQATEHVCRLRSDAVIFDTLDFDESCFRAIRDEGLTVSLSPIFSHLDRVDLAFTRAASPTHLRLAERGRPIIRAGARYATISARCQPVTEDQYRRNLAAEPLSVAISLGGADAPNHTLRVLETIRHVPAPMLLWVVLGEGYAHSYRRLVDCVHADRRHEILLARTNDSMWRVLSDCCVAILAGGITTYESAYMRIPSLVALGDSSDEFLIEDLRVRGVCLYAGSPLEAGLPRVADVLIELNSHRDALLQMHRNARSLLDNQGPRRIVGEILAHLDSVRGAKEIALCASA